MRTHTKHLILVTITGIIAIILITTHMFFIHHKSILIAGVIFVFVEIFYLMQYMDSLRRFRYYQEFKYKTYKVRGTDLVVVNTNIEKALDVLRKFGKDHTEDDLQEMYIVIPSLFISCIMTEDQIKDIVKWKV